MNKIIVDKSTLLLLYRKHKDYIVPIVTIVVCFILFLKVTIPVLNNLSAKEQEVKLEKQKLETLKNNLKILNELNESVLGSQLSVANDALPSTKNFAGVLNAVSVSANKAGIFLGDYEFQVGDLSQTITPLKGLPSLQLSLVTNGNANATAKFVDELYNSLPVSEVISIEVNGSRATLSTVFYFKPFAQGKTDEYLPLSTLSKSDLDIIKEISSWNNPQLLEEIIPVVKPSPVATSSAL